MPHGGAAPSGFRQDLDVFPDVFGFPTKASRKVNKTKSEVVYFSVLSPTPKGRAY